jgi:hypothetical protein
MSCHGTGTRREPRNSGSGGLVFTSVICHGCDDHFTNTASTNAGPEGKRDDTSDHIIGAGEQS